MAETNNTPSDFEPPDAELRRLLGLPANRNREKTLELYEQHLPPLVATAPWCVVKHADYARGIARDRRGGNRYTSRNDVRDDRRIGFFSLLRSEAILLAHEGHTERTRAAHADAALAFNTYDELARNSRSQEDGDHRIRATLAAAETCVRLHCAEEAIKWYDLADRLGSAGGPELQARILQGRGTAYSIWSNHDEAFRLLFQAIARWDALHNTTSSAMTRHALGRAFVRAGMYPDACRELAGCITELGHANATYLEICATIDLAEAQLRQEVRPTKDPAETQSRQMALAAARESVRHASQLCHTIGDIPRATAADTVLAEIQELEGDIEAAFATCAKAFDATATDYDDVVRLPIVLRVGRLYLRRGDLQAATLMQEWVLQIAAGNNDVMLQANAHRELAALYKRAHRYEQAVVHLEKFVEQWQQLLDLERQRAAAMRSANTALARAEGRIDIANARIADLQSALLEAKLQWREQSAIIDRLESTIKDRAVPESDAGIDMLKDLLSKLRRNTSSTEAWNKVERQFDAMYPDFVRNLRKHSTSIAPAQLKICKLAALDHTAAEIGKILGLKLNGVQRQIFTVRKRCGLKHEDNFRVFMASLLSSQPSSHTSRPDSTARSATGPALKPVITRIECPSQRAALGRIIHLDVTVRCPAGPATIMLQLDRALPYAFADGKAATHLITRPCRIPAGRTSVKKRMPITLLCTSGRPKDEAIISITVAAAGGTSAPQQTSIRIAGAQRGGPP